MWYPSRSVVILLLLLLSLTNLVAAAGAHQAPTTRSKLAALYRASGAQVRYIQAPSSSSSPPSAADRDRSGGGTNCGYTILAARGTGENQTDPNGSKALVGRVLGTVVGGDAYDVLYPATFNFATDPEVGASDLLRHVALLRSQCQGRKFVLYGYSQGAMVMVNALNDDSFPKDDVKAVVFFGDPYYRSSLPQNRGTATSGMGIGFLKRIIQPKDTLPSILANVTQDYCNQGDVVCQGPVMAGGVSLLRDLVVGDVPAHHYVGTQQEEEAIQFVLAQLATN